MLYISLILSSISLAISIYNWWYDFKHTKAKIDLIFKECKFLDNVNGNPIAFHFIIENLSHLDVSISRMFLCVNDKRYEFDSLPCQILVYTSPQEERLKYSCGLPLNIPGLGACGDFFCIRLDDYNDLNVRKLFTSDVGVHIKTNRKFEHTFKIELSTQKITSPSFMLIDNN